MKGVLLGLLLVQMCMGITSGPCHPSPTCDCPYNQGRVLPAAFNEPPYSNQPDVCTMVYASIGYTPHCVCRFVPKEGATPIDSVLANQWRDEDLEINPHY